MIATVAFVQSGGPPIFAPEILTPTTSFLSSVTRFTTNEESEPATTTLFLDGSSRIILRIKPQ